MLRRLAVANNETIGLEILKALRRIIRKTSQHSRQIGRTAGLSVPQMLCLRAIRDLSHDGEVTVAMVAHAVQLSPATVSRILDRLETSRLIIRQRTSTDRRRVCLALTDAGTRQVEKLPIPLHEQFLRQLESLGPEECSLLLKSLECVVDLMDAAELDASPVLTPEADVPLDPPDAPDE